MIDVGYAGVAGRVAADGRGAAVRPHARQDRQAVRGQVLQRRPGRRISSRRALRVADRAAATRTARRVPGVHPRGRGDGLERNLGLGCRRRTWRRRRSTSWPSRGSSSPAGGSERGASASLLAFAWAANPFTLYSLNMNSNDALVGALLAWTLAAALGSRPARGAPGGGRPDQVRPARDRARSSRRCATDGRRWPASPSAALVLLAMLALDADGVSLFWHRTIDYQLGRVTPMAIWTLPSYHPGWPDIAWLQHALQFAGRLGIVVAVFPRRRPRTPPRWRRSAAAAVIASRSRPATGSTRTSAGGCPLVLAGCCCREASRPRLRPLPSSSNARRAAGTPRSTVARPSAPHSKMTPSIRTPPSAGSKRTEAGS